MPASFLIQAAEDPVLALPALLALGVLLAYYLTSVDAYGSLSPLNLLIFLLFWLAPVWFLTSWVPRY